MKRLFACLVFGLVGCGNTEGPPLTIGLLTPSDDAARAAAQENGIKLALDELKVKADPALLNRPLQLRTVSAKSPDEYESQAVRLTSLSRTFALMGGTNLEETERLDHLRLPLLSFSPRRSSSLSDNAVTMGIDAEDRADAAVAWVKSLNASNATWIRSPKSQADEAALQKAWKNQFPDGKSLKLANEGEKVDTEVVFVTAAANKDALGERVKHIVYLGSESEAPNIALLASETRQVHWVTAFAVDPQTKTTGEFAEKYEKQFSLKPTSDAVLAYDGFKMTLQMMRNLRGAHGEKLGTDLEKTKYDGVTGPVRLEKGRLRRTLFVVHAVADGAQAIDFRWTPPEPKK